MTALLLALVQCYGSACERAERARWRIVSAGTWQSTAGAEADETAALEEAAYAYDCVRTLMLLTQ